MDKPKKQCKLSKNPCKVCLQPVTNKNGLRCMGACEAWVHFECINYTPGKIRDIKSKKIKVNCPCPDCQTTTPREIVAQRPYTCTNVLCPANNPPTCKNYDCQANEISRMLPSQCPPPGTLRECGSSRCLDSFSALPQPPIDIVNNNCFVPRRDNGMQAGGMPGMQGMQCMPGGMPAHGGRPQTIQRYPTAPMSHPMATDMPGNAGGGCAGAPKCISGGSGGGGGGGGGACGRSGAPSMVARMVGPGGPGSGPTREEPVTMDMMNKLIYVVRDLAGQVNVLLSSLREGSSCTPVERGGDEYGQEKYYGPGEGNPRGC